MMCLPGFLPPLVFVCREVELYRANVWLGQARGLKGKSFELEKPESKSILQLSLKQLNYNVRCLI